MKKKAARKGGKGKKGKGKKVMAKDKKSKKGRFIAEKKKAASSSTKRDESWMATIEQLRQSAKSTEGENARQMLALARKLETRHVTAESDRTSAWDEESDD